MLAACKGKKSKSLLHFCKFLVNPNFDLETNHIFWKPTNRRFQWYIVRTKILWTFHTWIKSWSFMHFCTTTQQVPIGYNGMPHIYPQNCLFPSKISTWSNTPISQPNPFTTPNGIQIQPPVLPHYTLWTGRQTDRQTDRPKDELGDNSVPTPAYALLY